MLDASSKALVNHWPWAAKKGALNPNTAAGLRAACAQVVSILTEEEAADVTQLDVEDVLKRFVNLKARDFKQSVLETYKSRFRTAVASFTEFVKDPSTWKSGVAERPAQRGKRNGHGEHTSAKHAPVEAIVQPPDASRLIEYPFPIREGMTAKLQLPRLMTAAEVQQLVTFLQALPVNHEEAR